MEDQTEETQVNGQVLIFTDKWFRDAKPIRTMNRNDAQTKLTPEIGEEWRAVTGNYKNQEVCVTKPVVKAVTAIEMRTRKSMHLELSRFIREFRYTGRVYIKWFPLSVKKRAAEKYAPLLPAVSELLGFLTPREAQVIILRYGLTGDKPLSLEKTGKIIKRPADDRPIRGESVRRIQAKALRKLRQPAATVSRNELFFCDEPSIAQFRKDIGLVGRLRWIPGEK